MSNFQQLPITVVIVLWIYSTTFGSAASSVLTTADIDAFQTSMATNLSIAIRKLADDILQPDTIVDVFKSTRKQDSRPVSEPDVTSLLADLTYRVETKYQTVENALLDLRNKLQTFLQSPRPHPNDRPPPLVTPCCKPYPPSQTLLSRDPKVGVPVDTANLCYSRNEATAGDGFNLWAVDVMDAMKTNYQSLPGILWQEFALTRGLHVQFPSAKRSCSDHGTSNSKLLRPWFRERLPHGPIRLVVVMDASDRMTNKVFTPGSVLPPISHWDIVSNAATELLATLMPWDKVSVVTTGGSSVSVPLGCVNSLFDVTDSNVQDLTAFIQGTAPNGDPDYDRSFRNAFDLFLTHESIDQSSGGARQAVTNVILVLTNGDNVVYNEGRLFTTIGDSQANLINKAHIHVYSVKQLFVNTLRTWLQVADQNHQTLVVVDGSKNVTATPWTVNNVVGPQGPLGYMEVIDDVRGFQLAKTVNRFHLRLVQVASQGQQHEVVSIIDGHVLQLVSSSQIFQGLVSVNASLRYIFDDVISFQFGRRSYAYVIDAVTGSVLFHPKTSKIHTSLRLPWNILEPDLSQPQRHAILSSDEQEAVISATVSTGRESFRQGQTGIKIATKAMIGHQRIKGTRFIVCTVIFDHELKTRTLAINPVPASGVTVYHRFDLLPNPKPLCDLGGVTTSLDDTMIGLKFSPEVYIDPHAAQYSTDTEQSAVEMNGFVQQTGTFPSALKTAIKDELQNDITVIGSKALERIWSQSLPEPIQRYLGTVNGVLANQPAMPLHSSLDHKDSVWYGEGITRPNLTIILKERFPGQSTQLFLSRSLHDNIRTYGVAATSISPQTLKGLTFNQVPLCQRSGLICRFLDQKGNIVDLWNVSTSIQLERDNHITQKHPWLANKLLQQRIIKAFWSYGASSNQMRLHYSIELSARGISSNDLTSSAVPECRKFALNSIPDTNLFILIMADRRRLGCPPEDANAGESCAVPKTTQNTTSSPPRPPPTFPSLAKTPPTSPKGPATPPPLNKGPATSPPLNKGPATPHPLNKGPATPPALNKGPATPPPLNKGPATPPPLNKGPATPPPLNKGPATPPPLNNSPAVTSYPVNGAPPPLAPPPIAGPPSRSRARSFRLSRSIPSPPPIAHKLSSSSSSFSSPSSSFIPPSPKCAHCPTDSPTFPTTAPYYSAPCQTPCRCHVIVDKCTKLVQETNWGPSYHSRHAEFDFDPPRLSTHTVIPPQAPTNPLPACPKRCSLIPDKRECIANPRCHWDDTHPQSVCTTLITTTTTSSTITTSTTTPSSTTSTVTGQSSSHSILSAPQSALSTNPILSISAKPPFSTLSLMLSTSLPQQPTQSNKRSDSDDDEPRTQIVAGCTVAGVTLFLFLLILLWEMMVTKRLCKRHQQVSDVPDSLHDGKRYSKDGLIIGAEISVIHVPEAVQTSYNNNNSDLYTA